MLKNKIYGIRITEVQKAIIKNGCYLNLNFVEESSETNCWI